MIREWAWRNWDVVGFLATAALLLFLYWGFTIPRPEPDLARWFTP